jgi:hypothetical protein
MELGRTSRIFTAVIAICFLVFCIIVPASILLALGRERILERFGTLPAMIFEEAFFTMIIVAGIYAILHTVANPDLPRLSALMAGAFRGAVIGGMFGVLHALLLGFLQLVFGTSALRVVAGAVTGLIVGLPIEFVQRMLKWDEDSRQQRIPMRLLMWAVLGAWLAR